MEIKFIDPVSDFSNGMEVLRCYHDDLLARGKQLLKLVDEIHEHGMNEQLAYRCVEFHSYYTRANSLHHQDEEYVLFPQIVNQSALIDGMLERLTLDHEDIEACWSELANLLCNPENIKNTGELAEVAGEFEKMQREHLQRENEDFLTRVEELLTPELIFDMAGKMAILRGVQNEEVIPVVL